MDDLQKRVNGLVGQVLTWMDEDDCRSATKAATKQAIYALFDDMRAMIDGEYGNE